MDNNKVRNALNELINKNKDSHDGYVELSLAASSVAMKNIMNLYALDRDKINEELTAELESLGGKPHKLFNILDDLHRAWIDIKVNNATDSVSAIIEEVERGEKAAIADYKEVIADVEMPESTKSMLTRHLDMIETRLKELQALEH